MDKVVVIEALDAWSFANDVNGAMQQNPLLYIETAYVDMYMYKAILVAREANENQ